MNKRIYYGLMLLSAGTSVATTGALVSSPLAYIIGWLVVAGGCLMAAKKDQ